MYYKSTTQNPKPHICFAISAYIRNCNDTGGELAGVRALIYVGYYDHTRWAAI